MLFDRLLAERQLKCNLACSQTPRDLLHDLTLAVAEAVVFCMQRRSAFKHRRTGCLDACEGGQGHLRTGRRTDISLARHHRGNGGRHILASVGQEHEGIYSGVQGVRDGFRTGGECQQDNSGIPPALLDPGADFGRVPIGHGLSDDHDVNLRQGYRRCQG